METVDNKTAFCPKCGAELEDDAIFCSECGASLKPIEISQNEVTKAESIPQEPPAEESSAPEVLKEEAHETEQEKASPQAATTAECTPPAAPAAPVPALAPVDSPPPQPAQKFCLHCGASLPLDALFCQKCGTRQAAQPLTQPSPSAVPSNINIDMEAFKAGVNKGGLHHVLLAAAVLAAVSVFLPLVSIAGMASMKLMEISNILSFVILALAAGTAYASMLGKYEIPVVTGHGFLFVLLFGIYKYQSKLSEMETNFWTALAKNAFRADWGFYLMPIAVLGLIIGGLMAGVQQTDKAPSMNLLIERWKQIMLQPVKIHTMSFQGIAWSVAIAILMIFVAMQSSGAKQLGL